MKTAREQAVIYTVGSAGYSLLELLWRGYTSWTMTLTGGICLSLLYRLAHSMRHRGMLRRCLMGGFLITAVEFVAGCIFNLGLRMNVWDYSTQPFNLKGQICLLYSALWCVLCMGVMPLCSLLRRHLRG